MVFFFFLRSVNLNSSLILSLASLVPGKLLFIYLFLLVGLVCWFGLGFCLFVLFLSSLAFIT